MPRRALLLAVLPFLLCPVIACRGKGGRKPPIVLISIDTLRADRLPAYGYTKVATPHIDSLARDAVLFENAYAHAPLTLPSHASLLTGLLPPEHGVRDNLGYRLDAAKHKTLPARLHDAGYATGGAVSAWVVRGATGLGSGFESGYGVEPGYGRQPGYSGRPGFERETGGFDDRT